MSDTVTRAEAECFEPNASPPSESTMSERGRFKRGQSGNPKGRPRKRVKKQSAIDSALDEFVTIKDSKGTRKIPVAQAIAKRLVQKALAGDVSALKLLKVESPNFLKTVIEAGDKLDTNDFYGHLYDYLGVDAFRKLRGAIASWEAKQRARRGGSAM